MLEEDLVMPRLVAARAERDPDHVACEEVSGRSLCYGELHVRGLRWARALRALGVAPFEPVLTMLPTGLDAIEAWLGLAWTRSIEVPVNTAYRGRMLEYVIENSTARVMVVSDRHLGELEEIPEAVSRLERLVVVGRAPEGDRFAVPSVSAAESLETAPPGADFEPPQPYDIATINYTSGTTGASKGVLVPWAQLHATADGSIPIATIGEDDAFYCPFPLFHVSGKAPVYALVLAGGRVVLRDRFDTGAFWSDIRRHRCTTTLLLGAMANFVYRQEPVPDDADNPLEKVLMVPLIPEVEDFQHRFGVQVRTLFNMTEISCPIASDGWTLFDERSCGRVRPGYQVRVVDEHDREVRPGEVGELVVRADEPWTLMAGYWRMPDATVAAWRNQWVHTGDAFVGDEDGNFYYVDRLKDAIRRRGENISSMEVEREVNDHPDVLESAAIAVPSQLGEDEVKIVVVRRPGRDLDAPTLVAFLASRMPRFMVPRYVEFVDSLPKTPTEKVRKADLRAVGMNDATWDREVAGVELPR